MANGKKTSKKKPKTMEEIIAQIEKEWKGKTLTQDEFDQVLKKMLQKEKPKGH